MKVYKYMKKHFRSIILMLLLFNYSYSNTLILPENDWKKKELKGKVKTMTSTEYEYDSSGKQEKVRVTSIDFNEQGYITKEVQYVNNRLNRNTIYENNKDGLVVKRKTKNDNIFTYKYEYTKDGNLLVTIKEEGVAEENYPSLELLTYDKNGKLINKKVYSGKELTYDTTSIYNEKWVEIEARDHFNPQMSMKTTFNYKSNGGYEITRATAGITWVYSYDKNGNELEYKSTTYSQSRGAVLQLHLKFKNIERDKKGNLTKKVSVRLDEKNQELGTYKKIENRYEYYN